MSYWSGKSVLVTGGTGFVGSHLVELLLNKGAKVRVATRTPGACSAIWGERVSELEIAGGDLASIEFARQCCQGMAAVFNLAADVAGVGYNSRHSGTLFTSNVKVGLTVLQAAALAGVERFLCMSSACVYPRAPRIPTPESEGFAGDPEGTNFGYGWAKRALEVQARCYVREYPIKIGIARPYNAYGPRDDFNWDTSHVIPALIRKAVEGHDPLVVWGDGSQTRSFLYVGDLVEALLLTLECYPECDPVNIGTEQEVSIASLVDMIVDLVGRECRVMFDKDRPVGQSRRLGDLSKAKEKLGFEPRIQLREGLSQTINWYRERCRR